MERSAPVEPLSTLGEMTLAISRATSTEAIYQEALAAVRKATGARRASVLLFDPDGVMRFKAWLGLSDRYRQTVEGHTPWTPGQRDVRPVLVEDVAQEGTLRPFLPVIEAEGIRAMAMVPLVAGGGVIGKFMVYHPHRHRFADEELQVADIVAAHTAFAIDRQRAVEALRLSEVRHRTVVDQLKEVVFQVDVEGRWTFLNASWERLTGYPVAESLGRSCLDSIHAEDRDEARAVRKRLLSGQATEARHRCRYLKRSGALRWVEVYSSVTRGLSGEVLGTSGTLTDVTEQRALAEALDHAEHRLWETQRQESLVAMAGGIAHDFNNLLMGVLGNAGVALAELPAGSPARPPLDDVVLAARRAAELTQQLLAYTGRGNIVIQPIDLSDLVRESARLLATAISRKASLTLDCPPGLPLVEGDATQLRQVAVNLLTNASDALGDATGNITLSTGRVVADAVLLARAVTGHGLSVGPCVAVTVRDSGAGMSEATARRIFDPFFTTKFHGRGLGLAAVLGIVRAHRGAVVVDSAPGKGTTFQVLLPEGKQQVGASGATGEDALVPGGHASTVLVIDDEALVRNVCGRILGQAGYRVLFAENGRRGLEVLAAQGDEVAVVLLDLTMPELSGAETLAQLRARWPTLPVVLTSGYRADATLRSDLEPTEFIQKPYTPTSLRQVIARAVASRPRPTASPGA
jgi:PAS domain S-box-containing protein